MKRILDYIRLINTDGIGPITFYKLLEKYGSAHEALNNLPAKYSPFPKEKAEREIALTKSLKANIIAFDDPNYPENLRQIEDAPPILYTIGNLELLNHPLSLSIVGARNASINGRKTASRIAYDLTNNNVLIISGMARGIDSAAHKGALYGLEQKGPTIAVLGTGIDKIYPLENKELYEQIKEQGLLISEFPIGTDPQTGNFPRRNRIVSSLSSGTLVVEAGLNSGSLITARLALEQGKDIFAIPGTPNDSRSLGPNKLIKDGAILVENFEDILEPLLHSNKRAIKPLPKKINIDKPIKNVAIEKKEVITNIEKLLDCGEVEIDELIRETGLDAQNISMKLLELELDGKIERTAGNKVVLIGKKKK